MVQGDLERAIARSMNTRWHLEMYHYMRKGVEILLNLKSTPPEHRASAHRLSAKLTNSDPAHTATGGNLFLDAVTWHRSDLDRVWNTIGEG